MQTSLLTLKLLTTTIADGILIFFHFFRADIACDPHETLQKI